MLPGSSRARRPHFDRADVERDDPHNTWSQLLKGGKWCELIAKDRPEMVDAAYVWPTVVLGAECLQVVGPDNILRSRLIRVLHTLDVRLRPLLDSDGISSADVLLFVRELVEDRLGIGVESEDLGDPDVRPRFSPWQLWLIVSAAACSKAYFTERASRWEGAPRSSAEPCRQNAKRALAQLLQTIKNEKQTKDLAHIRDLAGEIFERVGGRDVISPSRLQSLTEFAWNELVGVLSHHGGYPSWSELLVRLSRQDKARWYQGRPIMVSSGSLAESPNMVVRALTDEWNVSSERWRSRQVGAASEEQRMVFYEQTADLIFRQADIRNRLVQRAAQEKLRRTELFHSLLGTDSVADHGIPAEPLRGSVRTGSPPPAVVYVTTFDLEFELACITREERSPFIVVLPIHLIDRLDDSSRTTTLWAGRLVNPANGFDQAVESLRRCPASGWFLLSTVEQVGNGLLTSGETDAQRGEIQLLKDALGLGETTTPKESVDQLYRYPIVVHLMGAPLVEPPKIQHDTGRSPVPELTQFGKVAVAVAGLHETYEAKKKKAKDNPHLPRVEVNAVSMTLLEEVNAIRASLPEVIPADHNTRRLPRNLPGALWHGFSDPYWRYWLLAGVALNDPVVRYRVLAQLLGDGLTRPQVDGQRWPKHSGLAISRGLLDERAYEALKWCRFWRLDGGSGAGLSERPLGDAPYHLAHLIDHLERQIDNPECRVGETCRMKEED